jgi:methionine biosynthesis protein MetW
MKDLFLKLINILKINILIEDAKNIFLTPKTQYNELNYDNYWDLRDPNNYFQPRFPLMLKQIEDNKSILDIGCGDGAFLYYAKERLSNLKETGIDISESGVLRAKGKNINAYVRPLEYYADKNAQFDYVSISEVIEHVSNPEFFVTQGFALAKEKLIVTIPNTGYYTYRIRLLFGSAPVQWVHHPSEHLRFWTIRDFKMWLKTLDIKQSGYTLSYYSSNGLPYLWLYKLIPSLFGKQIVYVLEKK